MKKIIDISIILLNTILKAITHLMMPFTVFLLIAQHVYLLTNHYKSGKILFQKLLNPVYQSQKFKSKRSFSVSHFYNILIWIIIIVTFTITRVSAFQQIKSEIQIKSDNDFFIPIRNQDHYYTYGQKIIYRKKLSTTNGFLMGMDQILNARKSEHIFEIEIGQEAYTPGNPNTIDSRNFDRPFAGWLYVSPKATLISERKIVTIEIEVGVMGPASFSGKIQNFFHENISHDDPLSGWQYQIQNKVGINIIATYILPLLHSKYVDLTMENNLKVGSQSTFIESGGRIRIGWFNAHDNSMSFHTNIAGKVFKPELFIDFSNHIRLIGYNATLNFPELERNENISQEINNLQSMYSLGFNFNVRRFGSSFRYHLVGGDFTNLNAHTYGSLDLFFRI